MNRKPKIGMAEVLATAAKVQKRGLGKNTVAVALHRIVEDLDVWLGQRDVPYATLFMPDGHAENHVVTGSRFKLYLEMRFRQQMAQMPRREELSAAINHARGRAHESGTRHRVWMRSARGDDGKVYIDLGDALWRAVQVDADGWRIVSNPPVKFRRTDGMVALPEPKNEFATSSDGNARLDLGTHRLEQLCFLIRAQSRRDMMLVTAFMIACLWPEGPWPILCLTGEMGSAKSSMARTIVRLVDARKPELGGTPRKFEELAVVANARRLGAYDNVDTLKAEVSDGFCQLATGGGLEKRRLYADEEVHVIDVAGPSIFTGISMPTVRPDFVDRSIQIELGHIEKTERIEAADYDQFVEWMAPTAFGALLKGVSRAIRDREATKERMRGLMPRMADFAVLAESAGSAFGWRPGEFLEAYEETLSRAMSDAAESDQFAQLLRDWLIAPEFSQGANGKFAGGAGAMLEALLEYQPAAKDQPWMPRTARYLSSRLNERRRLLASLGIAYDRTEDRHTKGTTHTLTASPAPAADQGPPLMEEHGLSPF